MTSFNYSSLANPRFFRDNVLTPHFDAEYFAPFEENEITAHMTGDYLRREAVNGSTRFRENLNGSWKVLTAMSYDRLVSGWEAVEFNCHSWEDIYVPAHLQMEGRCGVPHYTNVAYPWDGHEEINQGMIPELNNPVAAYVKYFYVPERFLGERLYISFKGVESAMVLYVNGSYVGYSEDSFTPSDFEISDYLVDGENKIGVLVFKYSSGSWLEDQDFFRFSGIFRDVFLYTKPQVHAEDIFVRTALDETYTNATLNISLEASAAGRANIELVEIKRDKITPLPFEVGDVPTASYGEAAFKTVLNRAKAIHAGRNTIEFPVRKPHLWSAEDPFLYALVITLEDREGIISEVVPMQIGFREFRLKDGLLKLNGQRIVFNGVNRHEFSSISGRAITFTETRHDLINMKRNNINAIRTCHYPDNSFVYALADNLGLYVIDETNMETHGTWSYGEMTPEQYANVVPGDNPDWEGAVLDRVNNIFNRDKNHACVLIWSLGNESHGGVNIFKMHEKFHELDDTRPVHYEGICHDRRYNDTSDIESMMYSKVWDIDSFLKEHPEKPFISCEYSHAMGNSCGGMHKYAELTRTNPKYQGGFIWDYIDQSITCTDRYGRTFEAYGGDFGDRPSDYNFSGDGIVYGGPARESSPKMAEVKFDYSSLRISFNPDLTFTVSNDFLFTRSSVYSCEALILADGREIMRYEIPTDVAPLSKETYSLPESVLKEIGMYDSCGNCVDSGENSEYSTSVEKVVLVKFRINKSTLSLPVEHVISYGQYVIRGHHVQNSYDFDRTSSSDTGLVVPPYRISHGFNVGIEGSDFEIIFGGSGLMSYKKCGRELIEGVPRPAFWRAPTDNDHGCRMHLRYSQWKLADMYASVVNCSYSEDGGLLTATYTYMLPTNPAQTCEVKYTVQLDGRIDVTVSCDITKVLTYDRPSRNEAVHGTLPEMPVFGMNFCFSSDLNNMKWYGYGPGESYVDRSHGNPLGIWRSKVSEQLSRYLVPQECANKIGVRRASVTDLKGRGIKFTAIPDYDDCEASKGIYGVEKGSCDAITDVQTYISRYRDSVMSSELADSFEFQALNWTAHEIEAATHANELPVPMYTHVRIALAQLGIAGDDSWGAPTHEEYRIDATKPLRFCFSFKGI